MILPFINLDQRCEILICGDDGISPKPSPDMLISACESLKVNLMKWFMLGDAHKDIRASKTANMFAILACYGYLKKKTK